MIVRDKVYFMPDVSVRCQNELELQAELREQDPFQDATPCWRRPCGLSYKVITRDNPLEVWAMGFADREKPERMVAEGYWHRLMYAKDKQKELIVVPE